MRLSRIEVAIVIVAGILSLSAVTIAIKYDTVTLYGDAMAHLLISRRVIDGVTVGFAQLGSYWLPLPHLLTLPLVWNDFLFYSGLAGAWISMASYVIANVYLYKLTVRMSESVWAGITAVGIFALNSNTLYMQSTSMTELLMIATMLAASYHFMVWCHTESIWHLAISGIALFFAGLTRYEAWILTATFGILLIYVSVRKHYTYQKAEAHAIYWGVLATLAAVLWSAWSWVIFGDPLDFHRGEYSNPSLWVGMADVYIGSWRYSILTYFHAIRHIVGLPIMVLGALGLLLYIIKERFSPRNIASIALLGQIVFFVLMLYGAQRPLLVPEVSSGMYNIRFALVTLVPIAIFSGYLVTTHSIAYVTVVPVVLLFILFSYSQPIILLEEAIAMDKDTPQQEVPWIRDHYDGGLILGENVGNERLFYRGKLRLNQNVYEGSHNWEMALDDPLSEEIHWIVARHLPNEDKVWRKFRGQEAALESIQVLATYYDLQFDDGRVEIYKRKE